MNLQPLQLQSLHHKTPVTKTVGDHVQYVRLELSVLITISILYVPPVEAWIVLLRTSVQSVGLGPQMSLTDIKELIINCHVFSYLQGHQKHHIVPSPGQDNYL